MVAFPSSSFALRLSCPLVRVSYSDTHMMRNLLENTHSLVSCSQGEDGSDAEDNERDDQGNGEEDGDNQDNQEDDQEQDKEGFETLGAEEDDQADDGEELKEDEQQPQVSPPRTSVQRLFR